MRMQRVGFGLFLALQPDGCTSRPRFRSRFPGVRTRRARHRLHHPRRRRRLRPGAVWPAESRSRLRRARRHSAFRCILQPSSSRRTMPGAVRRYYLYGSEMPFAALVKYYQSALKTEGNARVRCAGDSRVRGRTFSRRDDGVSARRDDQGLHVERQPRLPEPEEERDARALSVDYPDCPRAQARALSREPKMVPR